MKNLETFILETFIKELYNRIKTSNETGDQIFELLFTIHNRIVTADEPLLITIEIDPDENDPDNLRIDYEVRGKTIQNYCKNNCKCIQDEDWNY